MSKKPIATLAAATMLLVAVPVAAADNPNDTQYGNEATTVPNEPLTPPTVAPPTETTEPAPTETTEPAPTETTEPTPTATTTPTTTPTETPSKTVTKAASPGVFTPPTKATEETLPFTGADLGVAFAVGLATLGGGLFLRRLGRTED